MDKKDDILKDYELDLEDLTFNSKPIINTLTMKAEKYKDLASDIVKLVNTRFFKVRLECKLPTLYLMDSMIKNLGGDFLQEMTKDIVGVFCHAFESLNDPKVRISLYKLRQTWPQYIPLRKLAAIDRHIHAIDPNWPVTAHEPSSPTIFLNPKFLGSQEKESDKSKDSKENIGYVAARKSPIIEVESDGVTTISKTSESHKDKNSHDRLVPPVRCNHSQSPPAMRIPKKGSPSPIKRENRSRSRSPKIDPSTKAKLKEDKTSVAGTVNPKGQLARSRSSRSPLQNSLSVHDKRKKVLEEQRQKKLDTQRAIGLLPLPQDDTDLSQVMQKHHRNVPDTSNDKSVKIENEEDVVEKDDPEMEEHVNKVAGLKRRSDEIAENPISKTLKTVDDIFKPINENMLDLSDLPPELFHKHQSYIIEQVEKRLKSGTLTTEQHDTLVKQVDQLYELQRQSIKNKETHNEITSIKEEKSNSIEPYHSHNEQSSHAPSLPSSSSSIPPPPSLHYVPPPRGEQYPPHHHHHHEQSHNYSSYNHYYHVPIDSVTRPHRALLPNPPPHDAFPPQRGPRSHTPPPRGLYRPRGGPPNRHFRNRDRPYRSRPPHYHSPPRDQHHPPLQNQSVLDLYKQLESSGLLPGDNQKSSSPPNPILSVPIIKLDIKELRKEYNGLFDLLHRGEPCTSCGLRFTEDQRDAYQQHLDWHFNENRMDREQTKATMRNWYLHPDDWMSFEGFQLSNQNEPLLVMKSDSREESVGKEEDKSTGISCPLLPGEDLGMCEICHEQLEQFWEEDEEEWHFKDTIRSSDGMLYHTYCFVDSKESHEMSTSFENENKPTTV